MNDYEECTEDLSPLSRNEQYESGWDLDEPIEAEPTPWKLWFIHNGEWIHDGDKGFISKALGEQYAATYYDEEDQHLIKVSIEKPQ